MIHFNILNTIFLALLVVFYGAYFQKMLLLKKQGIQVNILGKEGKPKSKIFVEILLKTFTYAGAAVQFASILLPDLFCSFNTPFCVKIAALILAGFADIVFIAAIVVMRENWRAGYSQNQNTKLVTNGIYKISRNPAFVGFDLLYLAVALFSPNVLSIAFAVLLLVMFHIQILGEEKFLNETFGEEYKQYNRKVFRYLGRKLLK